MEGDREIGKNIRYLGWMGREDFEKALTQCSIVIIPSLYESFSIAAYQALMAVRIMCRTISME